MPTNGVSSFHRRKRGCWRGDKQEWKQGRFVCANWSVSRRNRKKMLTVNLICWPNRWPSGRPSELDPPPVGICPAGEALKIPWRMEGVSGICGWVYYLCMCVCLLLTSTTLTWHSARDSIANDKWYISKNSYSLRPIYYLSLSWDEDWTYEYYQYSAVWRITL